MSQNGITLATTGTVSGLEVVQDINAALQDVATLFSGASAPASTVAYQLWADTGSTPPMLRQMNAANNAWLPIGPLAGMGIQSGSQVVAVAAGTVNAITVGFSPAVTAMTSGPIWWRASGANTSATPTLSRDGLTAKTIVKGSNAALIAGDIPGAGCWMCTQYDVTLDREVLLNPATGVNAVSTQIQPITASVGSSALTVTLNPTVLDFRAATLTSGTVNRRRVASAISVVVPSGATLGTVSGVAAMLAVLAIDNAGTVELAVVNLACGVDLNEFGVISTTALSTSADLATTIYSTTSRTNVPYRVVGYLAITEATAGTWASAPSIIAGAGEGLGIPATGRTWQNVAGSRASGTTYYNTTGRDIDVSVSSVSPGASVSGRSLSVVVGGVTIAACGDNETYSYPSITFTVPHGSSYAVTASGGIALWTELR